MLQDFFDKYFSGKTPLSETYWIDDELMYWGLGDLVADLCDKVGLDPDQYDCGLLDGVVKGIYSAGDKSAVSTLSELSSNHLFDISDHSGKLHFIPKGGSVSADISSDLFIEERKRGSSKRKREKEIDIPLNLHIEYYDIDGGLNTDLQTSERSIDNRSVSDDKTSTVEMMDADQAKRTVVIAHKLLAESMKGEVEFSLPKEYIYLTVSDVIKVNGSRYRIVEEDIDLHSQKYKCVSDSISSISTSVKGVPVNNPTPPPDQVIGETKVELFNTHILNESDDLLGFYVSAQRTTYNWNGVVIDVSMDGGRNFTNSIVLDSEGMMGELVSPLGLHPVWYPDVTNTLSVKMLDENDEVLDRSNADQLNRFGYMIVGDEIISYGDTDEFEKGSYNLTHLLRGRKGSTVTSHPVGTRVLFLDYGAVDFIETPLYDVGREMTLRITSLDTSEPYTKTFTITGESQKERAPARVKVVRNGGNMTISWNPVGKLGGGGRVQMGAYFTGFKVILPDSTKIVAPHERSITVPYQSGEVSVLQTNSIMGDGRKSTVFVD